MNLLNQEIQALKNTISVLKKQLDETRDQTERAVLQEKLELAKELLMSKLDKVDDL